VPLQLVVGIKTNTNIPEIQPASLLPADIAVKRGNTPRLLTQASLSRGDYSDCQNKFPIEVVIATIA